LAWKFSSLLPHVDQRLALHGLQSRGLLPEEEPAADMAEMVEEYVARIRRISPSGPYRLLGWSFGGAVAYELACRLQEEGAEIAYLGIVDFDPWPADDAPTDLDLAAELVALDVPARQRARVGAVIATNTVLGEQFRPGEFTGDLTLFVADDNPASIEETTAKWAEVVVGSVSISRLPGRHVDLLDAPFAPAIARTVNRTVTGAHKEATG
jgi:nonribosomal peptide synthetase DhbF